LSKHGTASTEDHPLEYAEFAGDIPAGEYGGGRVRIYDRGTYVTEKWRDDEVIVTFSGSRVTGRYALFQTRGKDWMIHRMDPPPDGWTPMPSQIGPMVATATARLPSDDDGWAYELEWDGVRALAAVDGGRVRLTPEHSFPELRALGESLAPTECLLDGVVVAFDDGRVYLVFDLLWLDGQSTVDLPYVERRDLLDELGLAGPHWQTPPYFPGGGGFALQTAREQGLPGVVAKRLDAPYTPGRRTRNWLSVSARSRRGGG
jgi:bifunctional non-homologous end joining protein LigD